MLITEQYYMYRLVYYFIMEEKYSPLHINNEWNEVWLEKNDKKHTKIIRFIQHGFNWKNHLKNDVARVFQRVKMMSNMFVGKQVAIYNVYVTDLEPVDDWETLKKTMVLKDKKPVQMNLFYITNENVPEEENRLFQQTNATPITHYELPNEMKQKKDVSFYKAAINQMVQKKTEQVHETFTFGKPRWTYGFMLISLFMFIVLEFQGGSNNMDVLIAHGAKYNPAILSGEWWRLITSVFVHIGFLHLFLNMIALYYIGSITERIYGSTRFALIYLLAGVGGSLTSFVFSPYVSAGASGALFGLFGALLFFGVIHKRLFQQTMGKSVAIILILNLAIGLFLPQIDMGAHLGGLIFGFLASAVVFLPKKKHVTWQLLGTVLLVLLVIFLVYYGRR